MTDRSRYGFVFLTLMLLLSLRCGTLTDPVKEAVAAIDRAMWMVQNESKDWRQILSETEDKLASDAQSMMVNEVNSAFDRAIGTVGTEFKCDTDFVEDRLVQDLARIKAELLNEPVPDKEPAICLVDPMSVDVSLVPERLKWVEIYGYDFDTTDVQLVLREGDRYVDVTASCLGKPTHYHMTIDLISEGCELTQASSGFFVLKWNDQEISSIKISQVPTPPTVTPAPDRFVGPAGGGGGSEFVDVVPLGAKVISLQIRSGQRVDSIQVFLNTGSLAKHGGSGGNLHEIYLEEGEYITAVYGRAGDRVDQIAIRTNKAAYGPYGGGGGSPFSFEAPPDFQIVGFFGRAGDELDAIGVIIRQQR